MVLAMLFSRTQFRIQKATLGANVRHHGCKTVKAFVRAAYPFFFRFGVVKKRHIHIHRCAAVGQGGRFDIVAPEHFRVRFENCFPFAFADFIHALA